VDAEAQLDVFLDKYAPDVASNARGALAFLKKRFPTASRLVYDNYNALVVGFGPNDKASAAILSIAVYPQYVRLFFLSGVSLPDPCGLLEGSGSRVRSIKLQPISRIDTAEVGALIDAAVEATQLPLPPDGTGPLIIKSVSARQRPRRSKD
jgi:hypothetical protein